MTEHCPWDGCDYSTDTWQGVKIHHGRVHGESISGVDVECDWCDDTFTCYPSEADDRRFCSVDCTGAWKSEHETGMSKEYNGTEELTCHYCGSDFTRPSSLVNDGRNYCDRECKDTWISENLSGENHPNYDQVECKCDNCGTTFTRSQFEAHRRENTFCSRNCYAEALETLMEGEDNPFWHGGVGTVNYGENWTENRQSALERDGEECQSCGISMDAHVDQFGRGLCVHHVIPLNRFDSKEAGNRVDNLLTLCLECHMTYEAKSQKIPSEAVSA